MSMPRAIWGEEWLAGEKKNMIGEIGIKRNDNRSKKPAVR
jgi:hypothetical protein